MFKISAATDERKRHVDLKALHRCRYVISPVRLTPQASLSMDEAARQTSSHSLSSASSTSATVRRPGSSQRQHRRTGSVGTVSEHEVTRHL